jgi:hypothetical protein
VELWTSISWYAGFSISSHLCSWNKRNVIRGQPIWSHSSRNEDNCHPCAVHSTRMKRPFPVQNSISHFPSIFVLCQPSNPIPGIFVLSIDSVQECPSFNFDHSRKGDKTDHQDGNDEFTAFPVLSITIFIKYPDRNPNGRLASFVLSPDTWGRCLYLKQIQSRSVCESIWWWLISFAQVITIFRYEQFRNRSPPRSSWKSQIILRWSFQTDLA